MKKLRALLILSGFLVASVSIAAITPGLSTTSIGEDFSYTDLGLVYPGGITQGDFLLAAMAVNGGDGVEVTKPSGWTFLASSTQSANITLLTYYRVADGTETGTSTWRFVSKTRVIGGMTRYSGVDPLDPIDTVATSTGASNTAVAPSVTTTATESRVIAVFATNEGKNNNYFSTSSGMTKRYDKKYPPLGPTLSLQDVEQVSIGASGTKEADLNQGSRDWAAHTIALNESSYYQITTGQALDEYINTIAHDQNWLAQHFTTSGAGTVSQVQMCLRNTSGMSGSATVQIETDSSGAPSGTVVASSTSFNLNTMPSSNTLSTFNMSSPGSLATSTGYWLVLKASSGMTGSGIICGGNGSYSNPNVIYGNNSFVTTLTSAQYGAIIRVDY